MLNTDRLLDLWSMYESVRSAGKSTPDYADGLLKVAEWYLQKAKEEGLPDLRTWHPKSTISDDEEFIF